LTLEWLLWDLGYFLVEFEIIVRAGDKDSVTPS